MKGEWTIITGACGGLGQAFCRCLAQEKTNLFLTGTNFEKTKDFALKLKSEFPDILVDFCVCDLANEQMRKNLFAVLKEKNIKPIRLINNAGAILEGGILDSTDDRVLNAIRVNCEGTVDITQKFIKEFKENLEILTVASLGAFYPMPYMSVYSATKSFLVNFMVALRYEVANKNIKVSTICPAGIPTNNEMIKAIESQGFFGKATSSTPYDVACVGLKKLKKNKAIIILKPINKFIKFSSKFASETFLAKYVGKRWKKANKKRK